MPLLDGAIFSSFEVLAYAWPRVPALLMFMHLIKIGLDLKVQAPSLGSPRLYTYRYHAIWESKFRCVATLRRRGDPKMLKTNISDSKSWNLGCVCGILVLLMIRCKLKYAV